MRLSGTVSIRFWRRTRALRRYCVLFTLVLASVSRLCAQQSKPEEYQVKAVYLYNFGRFVDWPAGAANNEPFTICVLGRDPFGVILDSTLAGESINNRRLEVKRIASSRESVGCQILFISSSEAARTREILAAVQKPGVLTVSDMPNFTSSGGMIQFLLIDNKVRFEVNLNAAEKAGLTFSSQLLKVSTAIRRNSRVEFSDP